MTAKKLKQAIVLNNGIEMSVGKKISQACHASLKSFNRASKEEIKEWERKGAKKIALESGNLEELSEKAAKLEIPHAMVRDAGNTEVESGSKTALGIGPAEESLVDQVTGELRLIE